jgi:hypothetical protein
VEKDIRYDTLSEEWNEYIAEDGTKIRFKSTLARVHRTNKYDKHGDPIYLIELSGFGQITPPPKS